VAPLPQSVSVLAEDGQRLTKMVTITQADRDKGWLSFGQGGLPIRVKASRHLRRRAGAPPRCGAAASAEKVLRSGSSTPVDRHTLQARLYVRDLRLY
jgi:hypothetical protein